MDVLRPPIVTIGGRCYRRNPAQVTSLSSRSETMEEEGYADRDEEMYDEDMYDAEMNDDVSCDPLELEKTREGYQLVIDVPSKFFGYIIGHKGETKKKIEQETQTQVQIPKAHSGIEKITIIGKGRPGISSAKTRIEVLVNTARQKTPFTHFVALPVNNKLIMERFSTFQEQVLAECGHCSGIDERIFQAPARLHLTITTLLLMNKQELKAAQQILEDCFEDIINPILEGKPLMIDMAGLEYMNDEPGRVNVLYGKVRMQDGSDRLQEMADKIQERFISSQLSQDRFPDRGVKLHVTLMNSTFRSPEVKDQRSEGRGRGYQNRSREAFDASAVLEMFGDFFFGEHQIDSVHIAERGSYGADGFYRPAGKVTLLS